MMPVSKKLLDTALPLCSVSAKFRGSKVLLHIRRLLPCFVLLGCWPFVNLPLNSSFGRGDRPELAMRSHVVSRRCVTMNMSPKAIYNEGAAKHI
jgi:hypothetical protein